MGVNPSSRLARFKVLFQGVFGLLTILLSLFILAAAARRTPGVGLGEQAMMALIFGFPLISVLVAYRSTLRNIRDKTMALSIALFALGCGLNVFWFVAILSAPIQMSFISSCVISYASARILGGSALNKQ